MASTPENLLKSVQDGHQSRVINRKVGCNSDSFIDIVKRISVVLEADPT